MDTHSFVHFWTPSLTSISFSFSFYKPVFNKLQVNQLEFYNSILLTNDYYNGTILFLDVCLD